MHAKRNGLWILVIASLFTLALLAIQLLPVEAEPDQPTNWQLVGQIGGPTQAVAVQGNYAYVGVGLRLVVLDVTNPITPIEVGATAPFPYFVEDIATSGTRAYVAAGGAGLRVVSIADPANPTELGAWDSPGYAEGVDVSGSYAYLADGPYGLRAVDISNPANPTPLGAAYDTNYAFEVAVSSGHAYIAAAGAGLLIADVSNPTRPLEVGSLDTPGFAQDVTVAGEIAYIADEWEGLQIVDISDPGNPALITPYQTPGWAFDVAISGTRAYVADAFMGLQVLDISNPAQPHELGGYDVAGGHAGSVAVAGSTAYVADRNWGLRVVNVSDPSHPTLLGFYGPLGFADEAVVSGDYAYLAAGSFGLRILDISDPYHSREIAFYDTHGYANDVDVEGQYAYVSIQFGENQGVHIVDISDPTHPTKASFHPNTVGADYRSMDVDLGIAYLAYGGSLGLVDVSSPISPTQLGSINLRDPDCILCGPVGVTVSDTLAYVAVETGGLKVVNVSNPVSPTLVGAYNWSGSFAQNVVVDQGIAYVADTNGLAILDVSNPAQIEWMGYYDTLGFAEGVAIQGDYAYIADGGSGLAVIDASVPSSPTLAGMYNSPAYALGVTADGDNVLVSDMDGGLVILQQTSAGLGEIAHLPFSLPGWANDRGATMAISDARTGMRGTSTVADDRFPPAAHLPRQAHYTTMEKTPPRLSATCTVTSTADAGLGTLRACLENAASGDTITFDLEVFPPASPATITLSTPLPWLEQGNVTIDASDAGVILDGGTAPEGTAGLVITSDDNTVRGLQIAHFPNSGIYIQDGAKYNLIGGDRSEGSSPLGEGNLISDNDGDGITISGVDTMSNTISGNFIGTSLSGDAILANGRGVHIVDGSGRNVVGGASSGEGNVISGNWYGEVSIEGIGTDQNAVRGNLLGADAGGAFALRSSPPQYEGESGIAVSGGASQNILGPGNLIAGNLFGIQLKDENTAQNEIIGNLIGTNISGTAVIGNFLYGIDLSNGTQNNRIGGTLPEERNIVGGSASNGINLAAMNNVVLGNYVGIGVSGSVALGNGHCGIHVTNADNRIGGTSEEERNVVSGNGATGICFIGALAHGNVVSGNYIGLDASGSQVLGNLDHGLSIEMGAYDNLVKDNAIVATGRNAVLINDWGSSYNVVVGNLLGTDASGAIALGNGSGSVLIGMGAAFNRIGGMTADERNIIVGGLFFARQGAVGNLVIGNYIGTDISGANGLNHGPEPGIILGNGSRRPFIGGVTETERNVISGNDAGGIRFDPGVDHVFIGGNYIGIDASGSMAVSNQSDGIWVSFGEGNLVQNNRIAYNAGTGICVSGYAGNTVRRNAISDNGSQGIRLTGGGNDMLPAPVILVVTENTVSGTACPVCTVEIFSDDEDEGRLYEGIAITDATGHFAFDKGSPLIGPYLTATATDGQGNTSQFSAPVARPVKVYLPIILKGH